MSIDITELEASARKVLQDNPALAREDQTWDQLVELGWLLVTVPEDLGGLEQGAPAACILHRELGRSLARAPFLSALLAADAIAKGGLADREDWLGRLTAGDYVAVALMDSAVQVAHGSISGVLTGVPSADRATHVLVPAGDRRSVHLVALEQPGVEITSQPTWDETRRLFDVSFSDVPTNDGMVIAQGTAAQELIDELTLQRDLALAADSVGGATELLDLTVEHLKVRRQYGRPLAMFQALNHRCADLKVQVSMAQSLLDDGLRAQARAASDPDAATMAKAAKHLACSVYSKVAEEAVQLHGGIAVTSEHYVHRFLKRALLNEQLGAPADTYALEIADALLSES